MFGKKYLITQETKFLLFVLVNNELYTQKKNIYICNIYIDVYVYGIYVYVYVNYQLYICMHVYVCTFIHDSLMKNYSLMYRDTH